MANFTGGCLCGTDRFRLDSAPFDASGSPAMAFASVPRGDYVITKGERGVRLVRSTSFGYRAFCSQCGTPLYMRVDYQPETADFTVATLDDPARVTPGFHIFWASRVPWFPVDDSLPKFDRFRPDTRGLEGTEPRA